VGRWRVGEREEGKGEVQEARDTSNCGLVARNRSCVFLEVSKQLHPPCPVLPRRHRR